VDFNSELGLGCLTPLSMIFKLYRGSQYLVQEIRVPCLIRKYQIKKKEKKVLINVTL
jgi:hypothetical protein